MKVQFMVEWGDFYTGDLEYKIVESFEGDYLFYGYDIYEVETDDISKITVIIGHTEYKADELMEFKDGETVKYYVKIWTQIE